MRRATHTHTYKTTHLSVHFAQDGHEEVEEDDDCAPREEPQPRRSEHAIRVVEIIVVEVSENDSHTP